MKSERTTIETPTEPVLCCARQLPAEGCQCDRSTAKELGHDPVNKPSHYTAGKVECIDAIESAIVGLDAVAGFQAGQVIKYVWRFDKKNGIEDLHKAQFYLARLIEHCLHKQAKAIGPDYEVIHGY